MTDMQITQLEQMHEAGVSFRKIAKALGISMAEITLYYAEKMGWLEQVKSTDTHNKLKAGIRCRQ